MKLKGITFYSQADMALRQFHLLKHNVVSAFTMSIAESARVASIAVLGRICISPVKEK